MNSELRVIVFEKPGHCVQCTQVMAKLDKAGVDYEARFLFDPETFEVSTDAQPFYDEAKSRGLSSAPVVVAVGGDGEVAHLFAGYNPVKIKELISLVQ